MLLAGESRHGQLDAVAEYLDVWIRERRNADTNTISLGSLGLAKRSDLSADCVIVITRRLYHRLRRHRHQQPQRPGRDLVAMAAASSDVITDGRQDDGGDATLVCP